VELSDEALLAGVAAGDADAMAAFVRRHQARVFGLALSVVGVRAVAEEVAQEAFVRVWRHAGGFDARRSAASTWLLTITRNVAIDVLRVRRDLATDPIAMAQWLMAPSNDGDRVDDSIGITEALRELPAEQAVAVVLSVHFGLTAREIAERQDIPLGTAKTRIRTGLLRLRALLEVNRD
jgi:RNA polymerase sigma-70 factor (ECF subfamily)